MPILSNSGITPAALPVSSLVSLSSSCSHMSITGDGLLLVRKGCITLSVESAFRSETVRPSLPTELFSLLAISLDSRPLCSLSTP